MPITTKYIGFRAFKNCDNLTKINMYDDLTHLGESCFENCSKLKLLELNNSNLIIGKNCFKLCSGIIHLKVINGVKFTNDDNNDKSSFGSNNDVSAKKYNTC